MAPTGIDLTRQQRRERWLLAGCVLLTVLAVAAPAFDGAGLHTHDFVDQRGWLGIPCAVDVLSNLPFALFGLWGLVRLASPARGGGAGVAGGSAARTCASLFFVGLMLTAAGSSFYHWRPDDAGLVWDRAAMVVPFAGLLGLAACDRVSARAGLALAAFSLLAGLACVAAWRLQGNVLPWGVLQFGGMAVVMALAGLKPRVGATGLRLGVVIAAYAVAKALEMADVPVFEFTQGMVAGHGLKHVVASLAALPVLAAVAPMAVIERVRHNARATCRRIGA